MSDRYPNGSAGPFNGTPDVEENQLIEGTGVTSVSNVTGRSHSLGRTQSQETVRSSARVTMVHYYFLLLFFFS